MRFSYIVSIVLIFFYTSCFANNKSPLRAVCGIKNEPIKVDIYHKGEETPMAYTDKTGYVVQGSIQCKEGANFGEVIFKAENINCTFRPIKCIELLSMNKIKFDHNQVAQISLVDTVAELDIIHAVRDIAKGDKTIMVIDTRATTKKGGTIKGSVNIPFNKLNAKAIAKDKKAVIKILTSKFGVVNNDDILDFSRAKTLYILDNSLRSIKSPAIRALLELDYPDKKLKYYRGGMNAWHSIGLGTVGK